MDRFIATPSYTREILDKYGLHAKKNYGQNFLIEPGVVEKIALSSVDKDTVVIEIGPGIGALTQMLAIHAKKVYAFEIDKRLLPVLADTLSGYDNVEIINQDFLDLDLKKFVDGLHEKVAIAANLPYYITTPLLFKIFESDAAVKSITVMMQKEVADRFNAKVNTKEYNALTIVTQYRCKVKKVMKVPKSVFNPRPDVDSTVLQFTFKHENLVDDESGFFEMVKACFKQRRKTMLNNYGEYLGNKEKAHLNLDDASIDVKRRAESLTIDEFIRLYGVQNGN